MSTDRTLKVHGGLLRARSVLTRAERIDLLTEEGKFDPEQNSPMGLAKVRIRRSKAGVKEKKVKEEVAPGTEGAVAVAAPAASAGKKPEGKKPEGKKN
jgi:small basic protein (TIGR04137 family)